MFRIRPAHERGHANHGWLDTYHTFSFADYHDPAHVQFRALRVMNEDRVLPQNGFGMHAHRDMEIVTYVLSGALQHQDSMGNGAVLQPGEFQRITAGTGIRHSEFNPSPTEPTHLYQIWLTPRTLGTSPSYEQKAFAPEERANRLRLVASPNGADGSLAIGQDASIYLASLDPNARIRHALAARRHAWLQVLRGTIRVGEQSMHAGDGAAISDERVVEMAGTTPAEVMLFDLP